MTIDLRMVSSTGNISYRMNFDTISSAVCYGDRHADNYEVLATYYDDKIDKDVTTVVFTSEVTYNV